MTLAILAGCGARSTLDAVPAAGSGAGGGKIHVASTTSAGQTTSSTSGGSGGGGGSGGAAPVWPFVIGLGEASSCASKIDGKLWCWGQNEFGELGDGTTTSEPTPVPSGVGVVLAGDVGAHHACALRSDHTVWCWGLNPDGELGSGMTGGLQKAPVEVKALGASAVGVSTGASHSCAVEADGSVWCWGSNDHGQLGASPVMATPTPQKVEGVAGAVAVAAGDLHTCALGKDGAVRCWGEGALSVKWQDPGPQPPLTVEGLASIASIAAGHGHACARSAAGQVWCWSAPDSWGTHVPNTVLVAIDALGSTVAEIAAGTDYSCAVKVDGTLWCWGANDFGQLGDGTKKPEPQPVQVAELGPTALHVAAGVEHTCAQTKDGKLWCWGRNVGGSLGDGTGDSHITPVHVLGGWP